MHMPRPRLTRTATRLAAVLALACSAGLAAIGALPHPLPAQAGAARGTERITGVVRDEGGQPLPAAQVGVVGTGLGAVTGDDGRFTITGVAPGTYQVRAQRIGYRPAVQQVTVAAGAGGSVDFSLQVAPTVLTEQVVVGYTTQQRRDVTDAVSSVSADEIADQSVATVEEALRGRVPGVQINASGEPGRPAQIFIRGQNFLGNSTPLYVVDGMYLRQNPNLNPDDIESIDILKDASAAAQYGAQAANGVVVIRTKRGRAEGSNRFELRSSYGFQDVPTRIDMMSATEWAAIQKQAYDNAGLPVPAGVTDALNGNPAANTDWQDAVFRRGALQDHNLTFSGGTNGASYLISGGFLDQDGSVIETNFRRYSLRVNSDIKRGRFTVGENIALSRSNRQGLIADPLTGFPLINLVRMLPTIPVRDANNPSGYGYGTGANPTFGTNPVALLERRPTTETSNQVIGSAFGEVELFRNLRYRLNLGINYENYGRSEFSSIAQIRMGSPNQFATLDEIRNDFTSLLAENLLTFDDRFGNGAHHVSAVAGYTEQRDDANDISAFRRGFSDENLRTINAGGEADAANSGTKRRTVLQSLLFRANYSLLERYLLTGSVRRDGSSRFGASNRWGTFSAVSVGWVASQERFFPSIPLVGRASFLKLRASTGTLGNQDIGDYGFSVPIDQNRLGYTIGGQVLPGATQLRLANPDIRWQENKQDNIGLDLGMFEDRLTFTADFYRSTSSGLLVTAPLPWSLGVGEDLSRNPIVNAGSMRNSGAEFGLTYHYGGREPGAFRLNTTATLTTTRNRVLSLGNGGQPLFDETGIARTAVGSALGTFYVVRTAGIFQSTEEVQAHTTTLEDGTVKVIQPNAQPGDVRYVDANGDGIINNDDRVEVGNGTPKYSGGIFFDGAFRSLDFSLNLRGAGGYKIFNAARYWTDRMDDPSNYRKGLEPWTPENHSTTTPRALAVGSDNTRFNSDRWIEDGGYLRVQNIMIGYTLPAALTARMGGRDGARARVYLNMQNLHTFTDFSNWDPETLGLGNPLGRGIDDGRIYPNVRTISLGLDLRL
ncbi:MAG TPA: SusC/RagA family TonB-linked outer membrane protein [Gemmatimonadaceae bacterium]|nr:SusC/RagA family TonB-linked outer membrane protein [Gemmatimonadaceae bacterium]